MTMSEDHSSSTTSATGEANRDLSCSLAVELLPWLLHGSLDEAEKEAVLGHLAECEDCCRELEAAVLAREVYTQHVPSQALAEYAHGLPPNELTTERIESHLAVCSTCRQEVKVMRSDPVLDLPAERERRVTVQPSQPTRRPAIRRPAIRRPAIRRPAVRRLLALAASLTVTLVAFLLWGVLDARSPTQEAPPAEQIVSGEALDARSSTVAPSIAPPVEVPLDARLFGSDFEPTEDVSAWSHIVGTGEVKNRT